MSTILFFAGLGLVVYGNIETAAAIGQVTPAARARGPRWLFWSLSNFTPEGQRIVRRGRLIQATGVALVVLSLVVAYALRWLGAPSN